MATIVLSPDVPASQGAAIGAAASHGLNEIAQTLFTLQQRRDHLKQQAEENRMRQLGISIPFLQMTATAKRQAEMDARHQTEREQDNAREDARQAEAFQQRKELMDHGAELQKGLLGAKAALFPRGGGGEAGPKESEAERLIRRVTSGEVQGKERKLLLQRIKKLNTMSTNPLQELLGSIISSGGGGLGGALGGALGDAAAPSGGSGLSPAGEAYRQQLFPKGQP